MIFQRAEKVEISDNQNRLLWREMANQSESYTMVNGTLKLINPMVLELSTHLVTSSKDPSPKENPAADADGSIQMAMHL